jgi:RNA polymerase sigma-70 factor, ECF subfamily
MASLEDLVMAAQVGSVEAFTRLIEAEAPAALRLCRAMLRTEAEAEDATQEAWIRAWRDLPSLRAPGAWSSWFRRITVRAAIDRARRRSVREVSATEFEPGAAPAVDDASIGTGERDEMRRAFDGLSPDDRAVLALRFYADLEVPDVASALGIPLGTAKSRLHRALGRLEEAIVESRARSDHPIPGGEAV